MKKQRNNTLSFLCFFRIKFVTNTQYSFYVSWAFAVQLNLFPQVVYYIYHAGLTALTIHAPNSFKDLFLCEHPPRTSSKVTQCAIFQTGKAYVCPVFQYPVLVLSYFQPRKRQHGRDRGLHGFKLYAISKGGYNFFNCFFFLVIECQHHYFSYITTHFRCNNGQLPIS